MTTTTSQDLIYRLSHDLQAPLRGISLSSGWIVEGLGSDLDEDVGGAVEALSHSVRRLESLLGGLLELSRAGRGDSVHLSGGESRAKELIEGVAGSMCASVDVRIQGDVGIGASDGGFRQVAEEILRNADVHGDSLVSRVDVTIERKGGCAVVDFQDDGPGVRERMRDGVFDLYVTRFGASSQDHVGVGLTVARATAEANGGTLVLRDSPERGACFRLTWPVSLIDRILQ